MLQVFLRADGMTAEDRRGPMHNIDVHACIDNSFANFRQATLSALEDLARIQEATRRGKGQPCFRVPGA